MELCYEEIEEIALRCLSDRQYQIWYLFCREWTQEQIAAYLFITDRTVRNQLRKIEAILCVERELHLQGEPLLGVTITKGTEAWFAQDWTLKAAVRRLKRRYFQRREEEE